MVGEFSNTKHSILAIGLIYKYFQAQQRMINYGIFIENTGI